MKKRFTKVISVIVAISTFTCATTVSSSALCLNDLIKYCNLSPIVWYFTQGGNCNTPIIAQSGDNCDNGNCVQTPIQTTTEAIKPVTSVATSDVQEVLDLVNKERKATGLNPVTLSDELCKVADIRAKEITKSFSHTRSNGTSCFTAFKENGITYRYAGENIAYGQKTATIVMNAWMNSSGHRANILNKNFGKIGIACYNFNGVKYWVQLFTN